MEPTFITRWMYQYVEHKIVIPGSISCALCGLPTATGQPPGRVFRKTFTDWDTLRSASSKVVCDACCWYMDNQALRRQGWIVTAVEATPVSKAEWFDILSDHIESPPSEPRYYSIKTFGLVARHTPLYAELNDDALPLRVRFDVHTLSLDRAWLAAALAAFRLREKHSWKEILADAYIPKFVSERYDDLNKWIRLRECVAPYLHTAYADLMQFCWIKSEERKDESNAG
jgi:hypothetical protein